MKVTSLEHYCECVRNSIVRNAYIRRSSSLFLLHFLISTKSSRQPLPTTPYHARPRQTTPNHTTPSYATQYHTMYHHTHPISPTSQQQQQGRKATLLGASLATRKRGGGYEKKRKSSSESNYCSSCSINSNSRCICCQGG